MKVLVTGAHFTPALAVIEELRKKEGMKIVYVGRKTTLEGDRTPSRESKVLPSLGIKFIPIIAGRLQRSFTLYTIPSLLKIPIGFIQAIFILLSEKPDLILSFGGYVAVPLVIVGWLFSIPIIVHEQTLVSGLANKISAAFADKIALSFDTGAKKDEKIILTGNPIRKEILDPIKTLPVDFSKLFEYAKKMNLPVILIMGGNQGSHIINQTIEQSLENLTKIACLIHVTGDNKFKDFEKLGGLGGKEGLEGYLVKKWIGEEIGAVLSKVDLAICRAGANSLVELAYFQIPSLIIPIPYIYQDEQNKNARFFQDQGLVKMLPQSKLSAKNLIDEIKAMIKDLPNLKTKAKMAKKAIIPDAAKRLTLETLIFLKSYN